MRFLISGASGMVGQALRRSLEADGHPAHRLMRPESARGKFPEPGDVRWDPVRNEFDASAAEGVDAVVHLAGASIAAGRWTAARKDLLRTSRVDATHHLVAALGRLARKPAVLVAASAVGYYGDRGDEILTEQSPPASDYLGTLCQQWEAESVRAEQHSIRTVLLRFGIILSPAGGALARMLLPFKLGAGGRLGSGKQWMSWLTLSEAVGVIRYAVENTALRGAVNAVASQPVTNADFTRALARAVHRPAIFPAPPFALRLALGEMADALLLSSQRVIPDRLHQAGYRFQHAELASALRALLSR